jgi:hypothetical protein
MQECCYSHGKGAGMLSMNFQKVLSTLFVCGWLTLIAVAIVALGKLYKIW